MVHINEIDSIYLSILLVISVRNLLLNIWKMNESKIEEVEKQYRQFIGRKMVFILFSLILTFVIAGIAATLGSYPVTVTEVYSILWHGIPQIITNFDLHFITSHGIDAFFRELFTMKEYIVWELRLPRILLGLLAGIGLAIAGTTMQAILRNPLASPFTLGISAGAGFGATLAIIPGIVVAGGEYFIIANAFVFSLIPTFVIIGLTRYRRATPETMILAGIAMFYIFEGMTTLLRYFAMPKEEAEVFHWLVGTLGKASWDGILPISIIVGVCFPPLVWKSWDLNVMGAGDEVAKSLGVNVERIRVYILLIASLLTAGIICFTGIIGFIGLVAPHICRMIIGGDNRFLIPASGLFGAALLLGADTLARTMVSMVLPVGAVTYFLGGPMFLYLILRRRREYW